LLAKPFVNSTAHADHRMPACHVVMPCAGSGLRAGGGVPKQYQPVAGFPMVWHTLQALAHTPLLTDVTIVVAPGDTRMQTLLSEHADALGAVPMQAVPVGGDTRAASVLAGLRHLSHHGAPDSDWVLVHDAARCLVTPQDITRLIERCQHDAVGGLLATPLADTLKAAQPIGEGLARALGTVERDGKWLAQTPQMFKLGALRDALQAVEPHGFAGVTDEASAMEHLGHQPVLVAASSHNVKVTYPQDFVLAEALLAWRHHRSTTA
jgi:2-C-methyl-D-erythritol 4-phosphate cytidylyltransferase